MDHKFHFGVRYLAPGCNPIASNFCREWESRAPEGAIVSQASVSQPSISQLSINTIRTQVQSIYRKLGVNNRVGACEMVRQLNLFEAV